MKIGIEHIRIIAKLDECHITAKRLLGESFQSTIDRYQAVIRGIRERYGKNTIEALRIALERTNDGMQQMMFCAAAVELSIAEEGSE